MVVGRCRFVRLSDDVVLSSRQVVVAGVLVLVLMLLAAASALAAAVVIHWVLGRVVWVVAFVLGSLAQRSMVVGELSVGS